MTTPLPTGTLPGVYFGFPEDDYHADPALGSNDIKEIRKDPEGWWRASRHNPNAAERALYAWDTDAAKLGKAMHKLVLEGRQAFETLYKRRPDNPAGASSTEKGQRTKAFNATLMEGTWGLHGDEWELCERTGELIEAHPDLADALTGGENEVSIFWLDQRTGVPCKCRYDRLKVRGIGDLKSIENMYREPLDQVCGRDIEHKGYYLQAEHYLEGRAQIRHLVEAGSIYTLDGIDAARCVALAKACAETDAHYRDRDGVGWVFDDADHIKYAFQFVFVQKKRPGVWSTVLSPGSEVLNEARVEIDDALDCYKVLMTHAPRGKPFPPLWRVDEFEPSSAWSFRKRKLLLPMLMGRS